MSGKLSEAVRPLEGVRVQRVEGGEHCVEGWWWFVRECDCCSLCVDAVQQGEIVSSDCSHRGRGRVGLVGASEVE